jgi:hypothetical protein
MPSEARALRALVRKSRNGARAPRPSTLAFSNDPAIAFGLPARNGSGTLRRGAPGAIGASATDLRPDAGAEKPSAPEIPLEGHEPSNHDPSASTRDASGGTHRPSSPKSPRSKVGGEWLRRHAWQLLLGMTALISVVGLDPVKEGIHEDPSVPSPSPE